MKKLGNTLEKFKVFFLITEVYPAPTEASWMSGRHILITALLHNTLLKLLPYSDTFFRLFKDIPALPTSQ